MKKLVAIAAIGVTLWLVSLQTAFAYYCYTNCWYDYWGNEHCTTNCF